MNGLLTCRAHKLWSEGKCLVTKFEFWYEFVMSLSWDCHELEVTPNLKFLVNFGLSLQWICHELVGDDISHDNLGTNSKKRIKIIQRRKFFKRRQLELWKNINSWLFGKFCSFYSITIYYIFTFLAAMATSFWQTSNFHLRERERERERAQKQKHEF